MDPFTAVKQFVVGSVAGENGQPRFELSGNQTRGGWPVQTPPGTGGGDEGAEVSSSGLCGGDRGGDPGKAGGSQWADKLDLFIAQTLALLLPLLLLLLTLLLILVLFALFLLVLRRNRSVVLRDESGPQDVGREHLSLLTAEGGPEGVERRWLEEQDEDTRRNYQRAKGEDSPLPPH